MIIKGELKTIDIKKALQMMSGYEVVLQKVIESFIENESDLIPRLEIALMDDKKEAARLVHSCKGISLNLGSERLYNVTINFEAAILENRDTASHMGEFKEILNLVLEDLKKISFA